MNFKNKTTKKVLIGLLILAIIGAAIALLKKPCKKGRKGRPHHAAKFDEKGCMILKECKKAGYEKRMAQLDENKDGCVTKEELEAGKKKKRVREFDETGCLVLNEDMPEKRAERLNKKDANNDGCLTKEELKKDRKGGRPNKECEKKEGKRKDKK